MRQVIRIIFLVVLGWLFLAANTSRAVEHDDFFESKIRPVLVGRCFRCHGGEKTSGKLRVDSREGLLKGGDSGPAIVPGKPSESLLIKAIQRTDEASPMPPDQELALRPEQIADFETWVHAGATWPEISTAFVMRKHWSFEPVQDVPLPNVRDEAWVKTSVDRFIRAKQEAVGIIPASPADKLTLIRRATFDLTGLPPTPEEVNAFLQDNSPQAFSSVVDRLLHSHAYGERWGRHWLDIVRYADTAGETADYPVPCAWRYRNYVIDAFNSDKPYDRFLQEQIAGDLLESGGDPLRYAEQVTATGFLAISRRFGFDSENYHHLTIQDTIDTLGQTVLGLSLGCARCHDHKFDPVSMRDYYALYGIFDSTRYAFPGSEQKARVRSMLPLVPPTESLAPWRTFEARVTALASFLSNQNQSVPEAVLRSLHDVDGDFELQAAAAGGSNGVLVSPWLYSGKIAVTNSAQSPYQNLHRIGKVGASIVADSGVYRIEQALQPRRSAENCETLYTNLDFRVGTLGSNPDGVHRISLGARDGVPAVEVLVSSTSVSLRVGEAIENLCSIQSDQWYNLQLRLNLRGRSVSGQIGLPGSRTEITETPLASTWSGTMDAVAFDLCGPTYTGSPAIDFDNFGIQEVPIPPVATEVPNAAAIGDEPNVTSLMERLQLITGTDGDLELQIRDTPPATPWNPGPASVVKISADSQSPFRSIYPAGELGVHLPNRGEYDGFGLTLENLKCEGKSKLFVSFDFRCTSTEAGGDGSWRYYIGHGAGSSAALELFFNGNSFFCSGGNIPELVSSLTVGQWYQVLLELDLEARQYSGTLISPIAKTEFGGPLAASWDGVIDYTFIDSFGHIRGVRPSLDADNFFFGDCSPPPLDAASNRYHQEVAESRRHEVAEIRRQLAVLRQDADRQRIELDALLANGPYAMTYGVTDGTPHNVRMHIRGEPADLGEEIARGFISVLGGGPLPPDTSGSGRFELARWITRPENPLTARVMVNRIWQHHFGRGLVKTSNDFGARGLAPTHPELLDHLATQFVRSGWSIKRMHRLIMLSATYQQSSVTNPVDVYAGFLRRRLSAEEIRDAILAVSGDLDPKAAQEHPFPNPVTWSFSQHAPFNAVYDHNKRSIYLMTQRLKRHPFLSLFDGADPNAPTPERLTTTVSTQALFFLNDPFVHDRALNWAVRLRAESSDQVACLETAYRMALGRRPTEVEISEAAEFLAAYRRELEAVKMDDPGTRALAAFLRTLFGSNEFLHVD